MCGWCFYVKKDLVKYIAGRQNAIRDEFIISREINKGNNSEYVCVQHPELPEPIYTFWHTRKVKSKNPKHTGGKKPYVMLMIEELIRLMEDDMPAEYAGYLLYLAPHIEWGTGRLIHGRDKRPMKFDEIKAVFGRSYKKTQAIIAKLKTYDLLEYNREGYFISRNLIKRGGARVENKVQEGTNAGDNSGSFSPIHKGE